MEILNEDFLGRMEILLKSDYQKLLDSYKLPPISGLRVNTLLATRDKINKEFPNVLSPISFYDNSFVISSEKYGLGNHPFHHAGGFYIQEPTTLVAPLILDPKPGEKVLDLCAAPGGKTTMMAALMKNKGLILANEFSKNRVNNLISNIERLGVKNTIICSKRPDVLLKDFDNYFDKILIDAPCSGEGMFRKNVTARKDWSINHSKGCASKQIEILKSAADSLKQGGVLVYSTCTFSKEENEDIIELFLKENIDFDVVSQNIGFGRECQIKGKSSGLKVFPFDGGEGGFVVKLVKKSGGRVSYKKTMSYDNNKIFSDFARDLFKQIPQNIKVIKDNVYLIPNNTPCVEGAIRLGVYAGKIKKNRFIPSHHLFKCDYEFNEDNVLNLNKYSRVLVDYMHGDIIKTQKRGYIRIEVDGLPLGFGKGDGAVLKNFYPKGLRIYK